MRVRLPFVLGILWVLLASVSLGGCGKDGHVGGGECIPPQPPLDFPFTYTLAGDHIEIATNTSTPLYAEISPWGSHGPPHGGHIEGDAKVNVNGFFAPTRDELVELEGDGNGVCDLGETCGVLGSEIDKRIVTYTVPVDTLDIVEVDLDNNDSPVQYGTTQDWSVRGNYCGYNISFGHSGFIAQDLRDAMVAAGYPDPFTLTQPTRISIPAGEVRLHRGDTVSKPNIVATEVPGHPGYYQGAFQATGVPWVTLEVDFGVGGEERMYPQMPKAKQEALEQVLWAQADNPRSHRYGLYDVEPSLQSVRWRWTAEMVLWTADGPRRDDYTSIHADLGGWWESDGTPCPAAGTPSCDELFTIFPIHKVSPVTGDPVPFYDPTLYASADVDYLVNHAKYGMPTVFGEVIDPIDPDPAAGTMLIKWRPEVGGDSWQTIAYAVEPAEQRLKIRWGTVYPDEASARAETVPVPTPADTCDGETLTCHNHEFNRYNVGS